MLLSLGLLIALSGRPYCTPINHNKVTVRSTFDDPRVLLWRNRSPLALFLGGKGNFYTVILNTKLLAAGTRVTMTSVCFPTTPTIIGIHVDSGLHAGATGFIDGRDVRP